MPNIVDLLGKKVSQEDIDSAAQKGIQRAEQIKAQTEQQIADEKAFEQMPLTEQISKKVESGWERMKGDLKTAGGGILQMPAPRPSYSAPLATTTPEVGPDPNIIANTKEMAAPNYAKAEELNRGAHGFVSDVGDMIQQTGELAVVVAGSAYAPGLAPTLSGTYLTKMGLTTYGSSLKQYDDYMESKGIDPNANQGKRQAVGLVGAAAELLPEALLGGISRYAPKSIQSGVASNYVRKIMTSGGDEVAESALRRFAAEQPGMYKKLVTAVAKSVDNAGGEVIEENVTEAANILTEMFYKEAADRPQFAEILDRHLDATKGAILMSAMIAPVSGHANQYAQNKLRSKNGLHIAVDEQGNAFEVLDASNGMVTGVTPMGEEVSVPANKVTDQAYVSHEEFKAYMQGVKRGEDQQKQEAVYALVNPNTKKIETSYTVNQKPQESMGIIIINEDEATGMSIILDQDTGERKMIRSDEIIADRTSIDPQEYLSFQNQQEASQEQPIDTEGQVQTPQEYNVGDTVQYDGKTGVITESAAGQASIETEEGPVTANISDLKPSIKVNDGKQEYFAVENQDGSLSVGNPLVDIQKAQKAADNLNRVYNGKRTFEVQTIPNEDPNAPDAYQIVSPAQPTTQAPVAETQNMAQTPVAEPQQEAPTYSIDGKEVSKGYLKGRIRAAQSRDDISDMVSNDPEIMDMVDAKWPTPKQSYSFNGEEIDRDEAFGILEGATPEVAKGLVFENDPELQQAYEAKFAPVVEPVAEVTPVEKPAKKEQKKTGAKSRKEKILSSDPVSLEHSILQYFIGGGMFKPSWFYDEVIPRERGGAKEVSMRRFFASEEKGFEQADALQELMANDNPYANVDGEVFRNALIDVILANNSVSQMMTKAEAMTNSATSQEEAFIDFQTELEEAANDYFYNSELTEEDLQSYIDNQQEYNQILSNEQPATISSDQGVRQQDEQTIQSDAGRDGGTPNTLQPVDMAQDAGPVDGNGQGTGDVSGGSVGEFINNRTAAREITREAQTVAPDPTDAQKEAGNYKKAHVTIQGLDITIENPQGSIRSGTDSDGETWQVEMANHYGYFKRTEGNDGDHVDVFIGNNPLSESVFIVDQVDPKTGKFDEHKVMLGFTSVEEAQQAYMANYSKGWKGMGGIAPMTIDEFKAWVNDPAQTTKPVSLGDISHDIIAPDTAVSKEVSDKNRSQFIDVHNQNMEEYRKAKKEERENEKMRKQQEKVLRDQAAFREQPQVDNWTERDNEINSNPTQRTIEKRNIWIPKMTKGRLDKLLIKETLSENDIEDLKDYKYFLLTDQQSAFEKGFYDKLEVSQKGEAFVLKNKFLLTNIEAKLNKATSKEEESANELANENTIVTDERYNELRARLKAKLSNLNAGFDPELALIGAEMAAYHIERGARKFVDFAKSMIDDLGVNIKPYLKMFYLSAKNMPSLNNEGMDKASFVEDFDIDTLTDDVAIESQADINTNFTLPEELNTKEVRKALSSMYQIIDNSPEGFNTDDQEAVISKALKQHGYKAKWGYENGKERMYFEKDTSFQSQEPQLSKRQQSDLDKALSDIDKKIEDQQTRRSNAIKGREKKYAEINQRNGLFGDTTQDPKQGTLFAADLLVNKQTLNNALAPFEKEAKAAEKEIDRLMQLREDTINNAGAQQELFDNQPDNTDIRNKKDYVSNRSGNSQPDLQGGETKDINDDGLVQSGRGRSGSNGDGVEAEVRGESWTGLDDNTAPADGTQGDSQLQEEAPGDDAATAGDFDGRGRPTTGQTGDNVPDGSGGTTTIEPIAGSFKERQVIAKKRQVEAESIPVTVMDEANIRETLPFLLPEQQDDVLKAETRFFSPDQTKNANGKGMMFTNGTGTGKTYTGLGIIKRFAKQGKNNILIVTPSQPKVNDWANDGKNLGLDITQLPDTSTGGTGIVVTTFANFRENAELLKRDFDLVVYDESHRLMEDKKGQASSTTGVHYLTTNKNVSTALHRLQMIHPLWIEGKALSDAIFQEGKSRVSLDTMEQVYFASLAREEELTNKLAEVKAKQKEVLPALEAKAKELVQKTKVVFLSATPFKGHFNLRYANEYLFDWGGETTYEGASRVDPESRFFLDNFGGAYQWRYHRLEQKGDANADAVAMQEVQFAEKLMADGVMSGRTINSEQDYGREFPKVAGGFISEEFNKAFGAIFDYQGNEFDLLRESARDVFFNYNYTTQLFEALKTSMSIDRMRKHLDLGRKIVVFHRRQQSNVAPPFATIIANAKANAMAVLATKEADAEQKATAQRKIEQARAFEKKYRDLFEYEKDLNYNSAVSQISKEFGSRAAFVNGTVSTKEKNKAISSFNTDGSGVDIIVVQEDSGKEGISLHDTTGKHQRVLISLSMPISSVTALQIEGRTYRIGQESNSIFEYPLLGLDLETAYFGQNINKRLSTTENLAVGEQSRDLIRSFAEGVLFNSEASDPHPEQGKGGKEYDKREKETKTDFQKARLVYSTNQKQRAKRDSRKGIDWYATAEPLGQKVVEWGNGKEGDHYLEPSAGNGAIAMWVPKTGHLEAVEPSFELYSKLGARAGGGTKKLLNQTFENLHVVNKYDVIVMNPPFGTGGKLAMEHLEKAFRHLKHGGRVVAIIPQGSMDKRVDNFLYGEDEKGRQLNPEARLIASIKLPSVAFEQAGTSVGTRVVVIDKLSPEAETGPVKEVDLSGAENINELFDRLEYLSVPQRTVVDAQQVVIPETAGEFITNIASAKTEGPAYYKEQNHSKTGEALHTVPLKTRLERDEYDKLAKKAKELGGYYSTWNKGGFVPSFIFKTKDGADSFIAEANKGAVSFKTSNLSGPKSRLDEVERLASEFASKVQNPSKVIAVQSKSDLAEAMKGERMSVVKQVEQEKGKIHAFYSPDTDTIYYVADNLPNNREDLFKVFAHEQLLHKGIEMLIPDRVQRQMLLKQVFDTVGEEAIREKIGSTYDAAPDHVKALEYLAHTAEDIMQEKDLTPAQKSAWQSFIEKIHSFVLKMFGRDVTFTTEELHSIIRASAQEVVGYVTNTGTDGNQSGKRNGSLRLPIRSGREQVSLEEGSTGIRNQRGSGDRQQDVQDIISSQVEESLDILPLHHATSTAFDMFDDRYFGGATSDKAHGEGHYFSDNGEHIQRYAGKAALKAGLYDSYREAIKKEAGQGALDVFDTAITSNGSMEYLLLKENSPEAESLSRFMSKNTMPKVRVLLDVKAFKNKKDGPFNLLEWDEQITDAQRMGILWASETLSPEKKEAVKQSANKTGREFSKSLFGIKAQPGIMTETEVRELLQSAGIDGIRAPKKNGNYIVIFDRDQTAIEEAGYFKKGASEDVFFSPTERALDNISMGKATAQQWKAMLLKNGAKEAEMEWTGLNDLLAGKESLTKDELRQVLSDNKVQLDEVVKGSNMTPEEQRKFQQMEDNFDSLTAEDMKEWERLSNLADGDFSGDGGATKYSGYVTEGGKNYKEWLLTMPYKSSKQTYEQWKDHRDFLGIPAEESTKEAYEKEVGWYDKRGAYASDKIFKSTHWEEPNIVVHTRTAEFKDTEGKNVLLVEEIQSDWAQIGKKEGFDNGLAFEIIPPSKEMTDNDVYDYTAIIKDKEGNEVSRKSQFNKIELESWAKSQIKRGVADMPFKQTPQWTALALRRMMRYAAENGFDKLAFVTGEQSADRYDLSKQIDGLSVEQNDRGYDIKTLNKTGSDKDHLGLFSEDQLPDVIGKEMANRVVEDLSKEVKDPWGNKRKAYLGLDLKVGGEGMKSFYDQIVPSVAKKIFKTKVGSTDIITGEPKQVDIDGGVLDLETGEVLDGEAKKPIVKVHSIEITPELKEASTGPQPMFKKIASESSDAGVAMDRYARWKRNQGNHVSVTEKAKKAMDKYGVAINVVSQSEELPTHVKAKIAKGDERRFQGAFDPVTGITYLVSENITPEMADSVIMHEVLAHKGLRKVLGAKFNDLLKDVYSGMSDTDKKNIRSIYSYTKDGKTIEPTDLEIAEEYIAYIAEGYKRPALLDRIINKLRGLIRKLFKLDYSRRDIMSLLSKSEDYYIMAEKPSLEKYNSMEDYIHALREWNAPRYKQVSQTETKAFKDWFGDSKVVDKNGKPLVVYHATQSDFNAFNKSSIGKSIDTGTLGKGFYFTTSSENANNYATNLNTNTGRQWSESIMPVYLRISNPYDAGKLFEVSGNNLKESTEFTNKLKKKGYDGVVFEWGYGSDAMKWYVAFEPNQIKSATGNNGDFDPSNNDIRYKKTGSPADLQERGDKFREKIQDRMITLKRLQQEVERRGGKTGEFADAYRQENLSYGRIKSEMERVNKELVGSLEQTAADIIKLKGTDLDGLQRYLKAKHAPERNEVISRRKQWPAIEKKVREEANDLQATEEELADMLAKAKESFDSNPISETNQSGFETEEANAIVEEFEKGIPKEKLDKLWSEVNALTGYTIKRWLNDGFISKDQYDSLKKMYQYYVPLRGYKEVDSTWDYMSENMGKVLNPNKAAKGRESESDDPIQYMANMANTAIVLGENNKVKQHAYRMAASNEMPELFTITKTWEVDTGKTDANGTPIYDIVTERPDQRLFDEGKVLTRSKGFRRIGIPKYQLKEHQVELFINGARHIVNFENPSVARAINKEGMASPIPYLGAMTRWMSANFTSKNPAFIPINSMRDIAYAFSAHAIKGKGGDSMSFLKNLPKAEIAMRRFMHGKGGKYVDMYKDFMASGGETGFIHMKDVDQLKKDIDKDIKRLTGQNGIIDKAGQAALTFSGLRKAGLMMEHFATRSENLSRFATYITAIENGDTPAQAASKAKEITVNFNRKGTHSNLMGSLFAFFNASLQGGENFARLGWENKGKFTAAASTMMAAGFINALAQMMNDDDEENEWDNISDYMKQNYIVVPYGNKNYLSLPLPHGFRQFYGLGVIAAEAMRGKREADKTALDVASLINGAVNPVDPTGLFKENNNGTYSLSLRPVVPTTVVPFYDISTNRDFAGHKIAREPFTKQQEEREAMAGRYYKNVNKMALWMTDNWFRLGGGDTDLYLKYTDKDGEAKHVPEIFDVNPAYVEHLVEGFTGGRGKFFNQLYKTSGMVVEAGNKAVNGENPMEDFDMNNVPIVSRLNRTAFENVYDKYYNVKGQVEIDKFLDKEYESIGVPRAENPEMEFKKSVVEQYDKDIQDIQEDIKSNNDNPEVVKMLKEEQKQLMKQANKILEK